MKALSILAQLVLIAGLAVSPTSVYAQSSFREEERAIAKEAYIYGFPIVDNYRIQYAYFVDRENPEYKAPWNQLRNIARVYTPDDKAIQTPNSDTPYSYLGADLRAEPLVLTVPAIEKERYYSAPVHRPLHVQLRLRRQPRHRQRGGQLPARRAGLEGRDTQGHEESHPLGDRVRVRRSIARSSSTRPTSRT